MQAFTESHHAFISAMFYSSLRDSAYPMWREAFLMAVRVYGEERGRRMAMRALRDSQPLDFASYRFYGEWEFTKDFLSTLDGEFVSELERGENYAYRVSVCPWDSTYRALGLGDGAALYCSDLDRSIARGFNPALTYLFNKECCEDSIKCTHTHVDAKLERDNAFGKKNADDIKPFDYHCAHLYSAFSKVLRNIYGARSESICSFVLDSFKEEYGSEALDVLKEQSKLDFTII